MEMDDNNAEDEQTDLKVNMLPSGSGESEIYSGEIPGRIADSNMDMVGLTQVQFAPVVLSSAGGEVLPASDPGHMTQLVSLPEGEHIHTITLADGSTAFIQPPKSLGRFLSTSN